MRRAQQFFYILLSFIIGVGVQSLVPISGYVLFVSLTFTITGVILFWKTQKVRIVALAILFLILGMLRMFVAAPQINEDHIAFYNEEEISLTGMVVGEPDVRKDTVKYEIEVNTVGTVSTKDGSPSSFWLSRTGSSSGNKVMGKVLVTTELYPRFSYGDLLNGFCDLRTPKPIEDFRYDKYLARHGIYSTCYYPKIELLSSGQGNMLFHGLLVIKNSFISTLNKILPEPHSSFLGGLLVGAKHSIPEDLQEVFRKTGTSHIVAVSGYNVTIIAVFVMGMFLHLGISRKKSFWLVMTTLGAFAIITGLQASIIRATIMGVLILIGQRLGRATSIRNALALTAFAMLLINPWILIYDVGFQLSFLATLGLVYLSPWIEIFFKIKQIPIRFLKLILKDYLVPTLSAIIITAPLILYQFGTFSIVAPLANLLVLPAIPLAMLFGFISGILGIIWMPLGWIVGWSVWILLEYIITVLELLAHFSWASVAL